MEEEKNQYPVVDLFAGPGGLGEGFAQLRDEGGRPRFQSAVSIENEEYSFMTLHLRHFLRTFQDGKFPQDYYAYLKGEISLEQLYERFPENLTSADKSAIHISLGPDNHDHVQKLIDRRLVEKDRWVLVGGPPCQAYSLVGRSRMRANPKFEEDIRHFLYLEYLKIIVDHAPPVFVMENVKGLLSARVGDDSVIERILSDLSRPDNAFDSASKGLSYDLYSLTKPVLPSIEPDPRSFLVRAEEFGVPQRRHRVFILGVRTDLNAAPGTLKPRSESTVEQMISGLPKIRSGLSRGVDSYEAWRDAIEKLEPSSVGLALDSSEFADSVSDQILEIVERPTTTLDRQSTDYPEPSALPKSLLDAIYDEDLDTLEGHEARSHMPSDLRRYAYAACFAKVAKRSPKLSDFPAKLLPQHKNVKQDPRSDLSFVAGILFYMLAGQNPDVLQDAEGRLPHQRQAIQAKFRRVAGRRLTRLLALFDTAFAPQIADRFTDADIMLEKLEGVMQPHQRGRSEAELLEDIREKMDTQAARRRADTHARIEEALTQIQRVYEETGNSLGFPVIRRQSGRNISGTLGRNTLGWVEPGSNEAILSVRCEVRETGDEIVISLSGEPVTRKSTAAPRYDKQFDDVVRHWLLARLHDAVTNPDALPAEADNFREYRPFGSLEDAQAEARRSGRNILAFVYDPKQEERGRLQHGLGYFLENRKTRETINSAFAVALVPLSQVDAVTAILERESMERSRWIVFNPDLDPLEQNVIHANPQGGERVALELAKRYSI